MTAPTIGFRPGGRGVEIDVDALLATRLLVQANSGGGKSFLLRRLLEQTHGKVPHLILDVEGDFHTLRERYDYVLAGREGADCPAHVAAAPVLARRLMELGVSAIIDISEMSSDVEAPDNRYAFVARFLDALIEAPRSLWHPALVVVDEAQKFCPESRETKVPSRSVVIDLLSRGRKRGLAAVLATQRLSLLAKGAAAECTNVMIGRTILDTDQDRAVRTLGLNRRDGAMTLRQLKPGSFYCFGPAFGVEGVELFQSGAVTTTHPRPGAKVTVVTPAPSKVKAVLAELATIPREAEQEARDLAGAKAKIQDLEKQLRAAARGAPKPEQLEAAREEGRKALRRDFDDACKLIQKRWSDAKDAVICQLAEIKPALDTALKKIVEGFAHGSAELSMAAGTLRWKDPGGDVQIATIQDAVRQAGAIARRHAGLDGVATRAVAMTVERLPSNANSAIDGGMQRVLDALAWLEVAGVTGPYERKQVAALADYAVGGTFSSTLSRLSQAGLIEYVKSGCLALMADGRDAANSPVAATTPQEIQRRVLERCDGGMARCLQPLIDAYPNAMPRTELAAKAGYAIGGTFSTTVSRLSTMGAISYPDRGHVKAESWLFLETDR